MGYYEYDDSCDVALGFHFENSRYGILESSGGWSARASCTEGELLQGSSLGEWQEVEPVYFTRNAQGGVMEVGSVWRFFGSRKEE